MANVPSVGGTGAPQFFDEYSKNLTEVSQKLCKNFKAIYVDVNREPDKNGLMSFYGDRGVKPEKIKEVIEKSRLLNRELQKNSTIYLQDDVKMVGSPHFLLIDPHSNTGCAIIWTLDKSLDPMTGKINGVGFFTRNISIINTQEHIFNDRITNNKEKSKK